MGKHFPMDLSKFKKVKEDAHSATLVHPEGHQITIAKKPLSAKMRGQIAQLALADGGEVKADADDSSKKSIGEIINYPGTGKPSAPKPVAPKMMAEGGEAEAPQEEPQVAPTAIATPDAPPQMPMSAVNPASPAMQAPPGASGDLPAEAQPQAAPQAAAPSQDIYGNEAYNAAYIKGLNEQKEGLRGGAEASGKQAELENKALETAAQQQQSMLEQYNKHYDDLNQEYHNFQQDVANQHIDPKHYMNSLGTGQRIGTAIGLILGGMGSGLTGQNPAMDYLNRQISNDIDAQKANVGKSENLLNANLRQFGNMRDAMQMTHAMQQGIVANKLRQAAAQTTDQAAKSRALLAAGQLDQQAAPVLSQIAMRRTLVGGAAQGQIPPENVIRAIVPPAEQAGHFKELQTAQNMSKTRDNLLSAFDQVSQLNTVGNRLLSPVQTARKINAISEPLLAQLVKDSEGRITPQDTKMIAGILQPGAFDSAETKEIARNQLNKFVSEKMNFPMLKAIGIRPENFGRYNERGQSKIQESAPNLGK